MIEEKNVGTTSNKKKVSALAILCVVMIGLCILFFLANHLICSNTSSMLVGKTFSGNYIYFGNSTFNGMRVFTIRDDYTVKIVDEEVCDITVHYHTDGGGSVEDRDETIVYENVPYTLSGGLFGVTLEWNRHEELNRGTFLVKTSADKIMLIDDDFMTKTLMLTGHK